MGRETAQGEKDRRDEVDRRDERNGVKREEENDRDETEMHEWDERDGEV